MLQLKIKGQVKRLALFLLPIDKTIIWSYDVSGGVVCIVVDIFVSNWLDELIDSIAK